MLPAVPVAVSRKYLLIFAEPVRRTAKRGTNVGGEFWGCTGYPACRGTRPIN